MYPFINFVGEYPLGHPDVRAYHSDVCWTKPEDMIDPITGKKLKGKYQHLTIYYI